jgi:hypothetical protein
MPNEKAIQKYGVTWGRGATDAAIELWMAFDVHPSSTPSLHTAPGFMGAFEHLQRAIDLIWNKKGPVFIWNEWTEMMMRGFIEEREVALSGAGASWKTTSMSLYAVCFWMADPLNSRIVITSTTLDGLRARIWKEVAKFFRASQCGFGNIVNHPHPQIQTVKGDSGTGIFGIAVEQGDVDKAVENIQGRHAPKTLVEVDEMTGVSAAIVNAGANLEKGCTRFQMIGSANPESEFDQHGIFAEPENGFASITPETGKWRTKRGGLGIHLNGLKNPNVMAGRNIFPGMITIDDIEISKKRDGENSPKFWKYVIGFWCPEGITKTVLSSTMIDKFKAREKAVWIGDYTIGAGLDPAFEGGDRCILRFGKCGMVEIDGIVDRTLNGIVNPRKEQKSVISLSDRIQIKIDVTSKEPIHYQIARKVKDECTTRGVEPRMFALDSTGEGGGLADILSREWSPEIMRVEFGGRASDQPVSDTNPRPAYEEYFNRVTDLWLYFRTLIQQGQIRGLDIDTAQEFCKRYYDMRGNLMRLESKSEMKARTGRSPDDADAVVVLAALFRKRSNDLSKTSGEYARSKRWKDFIMTRNHEVEYAVAE